MRSHRVNDQKQTEQTTLIPSILLLTAFALSLTGLTSESLWGDEIWSLWAVRDGWETLWLRVAGDVHPPLYFLLLRGWMLIAGESSYAVRFLSLGFGLVALAITYALGRRLFDWPSALIAMIWLGSSGLWVYYTREARMYTLVMALAALSIWCYWRWLQVPDSLTTLLGLALCNVALLYTHYAGTFLLLTELLHLVLCRPRQLTKGLLAGVLTFLCYVPWLPAFLQQIAAHPSGLNLAPTPTNWATTAWIFQGFTGGVGIIMLLSYGVGKGWQLLTQHKQSAWLLLLWALLSPLLMLALNRWGIAIYEIRYVIGALPAFALLAAYGLRHIAWRPLGVGLLLLFMAANLFSLRWLRPAKPPWEATIRATVAARQPEEPTLIALIEPLGPERYYDRLLRMQNDNALDLAPLRYEPQLLRRRVEQVAAAPAVWVMMPSNIAASWLTVAVLAKTRGIGYRTGVEYMIFYRFDHAGASDLAFHFGEQLRYLDPLFAEQPVRSPGAQYCRQFHLQALTDLPPRYSMGMHLIDNGNQLIAQDDQGLAAVGAPALLQPTFCIEIPPAILPGTYYLHLVVYTWQDGARLPVYEQGVQWGNALIFDQLEVP